MCTKATLNETYWEWKLKRKNFIPSFFIYFCKQNSSYFKLFLSSIFSENRRFKWKNFISLFYEEKIFSSSVLLNAPCI